jgi:hypothetical protein
MKNEVYNRMKHFLNVSGAVLLALALFSGCNGVFFEKPVAESGGSSSGIGNLEINFRDPVKTIFPGLDNGSYSEIGLTYAWEPDTSGGVNTGDLEAAIIDAYSAYIGVFSAANTNDTTRAQYPVGSYLVPSATADAFKNSIDASRDALVSALEGGLDQTGVDAARTALNGARTTFQSARKEGTKDDRAALKTAIIAAYAARAAVVIDSNGNNVPNTVQYVSSSTWNTFKTIIEAAEAALKNLDATQPELTNAAAALTASASTEGSTNWFNATNQKKTGTNTGGVGYGEYYVSRATLKVALANAYAAKAAVISYGFDPEPSNVPNGVQYVYGDLLSNLDNAIAAAEGVYKRVVTGYDFRTGITSGVTTTELNAAADVLNTARNSFRGADAGAGKYQNIKTGTGGGIDRSGLIDAINAGYRELIGVKSVLTDAGALVVWALEAHYETLDDALINANISVLGNVNSSQETLNARKQLVETATTTFKGQKHTGEFTGAPPEPGIIPGGAYRHVTTLPVSGPGKWKITATAYVEEVSVLYGSASVKIEAGKYHTVDINMTNTSFGFGTLEYNITGLENEFLQNYSSTFSWYTFQPGTWTVDSSSVRSDVGVQTPNMVLEIPAGSYGLKLVAKKKDSSGIQANLYEEVAYVYKNQHTLALIDVDQIIKDLGQGIFTFTRPGDQTVRWEITELVSEAVHVIVQGNYSDVRWFIDGYEVLQGGGYTGADEFTDPSYLYITGNNNNEFYIKRKDLTGSNTTAGQQDLAAGPHHITAVAYDDDNQRWDSKRLFFIIGAAEAGN